MTTIALTNTIRTSRTTIWLVGVSFVLFQFFLQLSSGVVIGAIMQEMQLSALATGLLSSAFYYVYTSLQIPVGILFDIKNTRFLLTSTALLCSLGCYLFAQSHDFIFLFASRLLIGGGAAFAFIGVSNLLRAHYPLQQFAFMIGLSETLGFIITMLGMVGLGLLIQHWGWRAFLNIAALLGLVIAYFLWRIIPSNKPIVTVKTSRWQQLVHIITSFKLWVNGLFVGLCFTVITVFGAMWAIPFIQMKLSCSLKEASIIDAMLFLGAAVSCPLFGYLSSRLKRRRPLMLFSCLATALFLMLVLFLPTNNHVLLAILMFLIGTSCGAYMLAFTIANELSPPDSLATCTGFVNTLAMASAPLLQPFIGYLLDKGNTLANYQYALSSIPLLLVIASALTFLLPEKNT